MPQLPWIPKGPLVARVRAEFGADLRSAKVVSGGRNGMCYWNADAYLSQSGGTIRYGWQIFIWPRLYIVGLHHAVVETSAGSLLDVTALENPATKETTIVLDQSTVPARDVPEFIPKRFIVLKDIPAVAQLIAANRQQENAMRRLWQEASRQGIPFDPTGTQVLLEETDEAIAAKGEYQASLDAVDLARAACKLASKR